LARNVTFVCRLMEGGECKFIAADMPTVSKLTIHILAAVAEEEARISASGQRPRWRLPTSAASSLATPSTSDQALAADQAAAKP
jgi:CTP:molybdopterin cytidylyltransferase MocA